MAPDSNPDAVAGCISHSLFPPKKKKNGKKWKTGKSEKHEKGRAAR